MFDMFRLAEKVWALLPPKGRVSLIHVNDLARLLVAVLAAHDDATARFEADDGVEGGWTHGRFARAIGWAIGRRVMTLHAPRVRLIALAHIDESGSQGDRALAQGARLTMIVLHSCPFILSICGRAPM